MTFVQCWPNVENVEPTLYKCYTNVLCLMGELYQPDCDLTQNHCCVYVEDVDPPVAQRWANVLLRDIRRQGGVAYYRQFIASIIAHNTIFFRYRLPPPPPPPRYARSAKSRIMFFLYPYCFYFIIYTNLHVAFIFVLEHLFDAFVLNIVLQFYYLTLKFKSTLFARKIKTTTWFCCFCDPVTYSYYQK